MDCHKTCPTTPDNTRKRKHSLGVAQRETLMSVMFYFLSDPHIVVNLTPHI